MKRSSFYFKFNLIFILIFLNIWDFLVDRTFFNGMAIGLVMFAPTAFLWFLGTFRAAIVVTLISIMEFMVMTIFLAEGVEIGGGAAFSLKSLFWLPYLVVAALNGYWGLKIYSEKREKKK